MLEFLVFGTFWFWASCAAFFILVLAASENDKNFLAFLSFAGFLALQHFAGNLNIGEILSHPLQLAMWVLIYFAVGTVWSVLKWFSKLHQKRDQFLEIREKYVKGLQPVAGGNPPIGTKEPIPDSHWEAFSEFLRDNGYRPNPIWGGRITNRKDVKPDWSQWKGRLTGWILWWPTSMFWTILNDPLVRLANWIRDRFRRVYSFMADKAFADV